MINSQVGQRNPDFDACVFKIPDLYFQSAEHFTTDSHVKRNGKQPLSANKHAAFYPIQIYLVKLLTNALMKTGAKGYYVAQSSDQGNTHQWKANCVVEIIQWNRGDEDGH